MEYQKVRDAEVHLLSDYRLLELALIKNYSKSLDNEGIRSVITFERTAD